MLAKKVSGHIPLAVCSVLCKYCVWRHLRSNFTCSDLSKCSTVRSGVLRTWADAGPLKVKYLVNAEKLKLNLQSDPLIVNFFPGRRTMLKEIAFEQCIATWGSILVRQSL